MSDLLRYPLSLQQKLLSRLEAQGSAPLVQAIIYLNRVYDFGRIQEVILEILEQHEALRCSLLSQEGFIYPLQTFPPTAAFANRIRLIKGGLSELERQAAASRLCVNSRDPFMADVFQQEHDMSVIFTCSGYCADGRSITILGTELCARLQGVPAEATKDDITFLQFIQWQTDLTEHLRDDERAFWKNGQDSRKQCFRFATPAQAPSRPEKVKCFTLDERLANRLSETLQGQEEETLLASWMIVLSRHNDDAPVTLGYYPQSRVFAEINNLVGPVSNVVPLTTSFSGSDSLAGAVAAVNAALMDALANQFHYLASGDGNAFELPEAFEFTRAADEHFSLISFLSHHHQHTIKLSIVWNHKSIAFQYQYDDRSYEDHAVHVLHEQMVAVLEVVVAEKSRVVHNLTLFPEDDVKNFDMGNGAVRQLPHKTVVEMFDAVVRNHPDNLAVNFAGSEVTYRALKQASERVAAALNSKYGVTKNDRVAVYMDRSDKLIAALLGIMHAGAVYVPIDPKDAPGRIISIINDSGCKLVIADDGARAMASPNIRVVELSELQKVQDGTSSPVMSEILPSDPVYIIYTSGTSGRPKGVVIRHESLVNYVSWIQGSFEVSSTDSSAITSSHAFDLIYTSLWVTLLSGGTLHVVPEYLIQTPEVFVQYLITRAVTFLKLTPSVVGLLLAEGANSMPTLLANLRLLILGGERYRSEDIETLWNWHPSLRIVNHYGPTETTVGVLAGELSREFATFYRQHCIVGKPSDNNRIFVLNAALMPCAPGVPGDIYVGGLGVSAGYFGNDAMTDERFIHHRQLNLRLYKTGDRGCWTLHGSLEYIGRADNQFKINGYRVEPAEIEVAARANPVIKDAVVRVLEPSHVLVCYYVADTAIDSMAFRNGMRELLPDYMIPSVIKKIPAIPVTANGKVDYAALPVVFAENETEGSVDATNDSERKILNIWKEVLSNDRLGVYDNFFEHGGDSIKAIQIASRLHTAGYTVHVKDIFGQPQVALLARTIKCSALAQRHEPIEGAFPMTPVFYYFFEYFRHAPHQYNQSLVLEVGALELDTIQPAVSALTAHHDILRLTFSKSLPGEWVPYIQSLGFMNYVTVSEVNDLTDDSAIERYAAEVQSRFNLENGPLIRFHIFKRKRGNRLLIVMHHLVTDMLSWNILLDDLKSLLQSPTPGSGLTDPKTSSYRTWANRLAQYAAEEELQKQLPYWQAVPPGDTLRPELQGGNNFVFNMAVASASLSQEDTAKLLLACTTGAGIESCLLAAMSRALYEAMALTRMTFLMESHGRECIDDSIVLHRTMGWFTALYPFYIGVTDTDFQSHLERIDGNLKKIPQRGIGYGVLRYMTEEGRKTLTHKPSLRFNFLGANEPARIDDTPFQPVAVATGAPEDAGEERPHLLDVVAFIAEGALTLHMSYSREQFGERSLNHVLAVAVEKISHVAGLVPKASKLVSSDLTYDQISQDELDHFF